MAKTTYTFASDIIVCGERNLVGGTDSIPMVSGDYCQFDDAKLTLDLYPNQANYAQTVYATLGLISTLVANGVLVSAASLPGGYPTPIA